MEKSFLELLGEEKRALLDVESSKESAVDFLNKAEMEVDPEMKEIQKKIASDYKEMASQAEEKLLKIRKEIKQYISFLEAL